MKLFLLSTLTLFLLSGCAITRFQELPNGDNQLRLVGWYMKWDKLAIEAKEESIEICDNKEVLVKKEENLKIDKSYYHGAVLVRNITPIYKLTFSCSEKIDES
jgi:hypothetical protein